MALSWVPVSTLELGIPPQGNDVSYAAAGTSRLTDAKGIFGFNQVPADWYKVSARFMERHDRPTNPLPALSAPTGIELTDGQNAELNIAPEEEI